MTDSLEKFVQDFTSGMIHIFCPTREKRAEMTTLLRSCGVPFGRSGWSEKIANGYIEPVSSWDTIFMSQTCKGIEYYRGGGNLSVELALSASCRLLTADDVYFKYFYRAEEIDTNGGDHFNIDELFP